MKKISLLGVLFPFSVALAGQNLSHISCSYSKDQTGWRLGQVTHTNKSFTLAPGQKKFLTGMWTNGKPVLPNYAACTLMVGTNSDDSVIIENYRYKADEFQPMDATENCSVTGKGVELMSKESLVIQRGSYSMLELEWAPPHVDKIQVREYFPTMAELSQIRDIAMDKCGEIAPAANE